MVPLVRVRKLVSLGLLLVVSRPVAVSGQSRVHFGTCDASAVVGVGDGMFLMATDEDNSLRLYESNVESGALQTFDMSQFLEVDPKQPEADIEAVATLGDLTIWITSHGRSKNGKVRDSRRRLFATRIERTGESVQVTPVGKPYKRLLDDLVAAPQLKSLDLAAAEKLAPTQPGALNIEGLVASADGKLWIGLRSPVPRGKALLVPIENPREVIDGAAAKLGPAYQLDLQGLGIRSIEYSPEEKIFYIAAGGATDGDEFALYEWSGKSADPPRKLPTTIETDYTPEAIGLMADFAPTRLIVISEDSQRQQDGQDCKDLADPARMSFRSVEVQLDGTR